MCTKSPPSKSRHCILMQLVFQCPYPLDADGQLPVHGVLLSQSPDVTCMHSSKTLRCCSQAHAACSLLTWKAVPIALKSALEMSCAQWYDVLHSLLDASASWTQSLPGMLCLDSVPFTCESSTLRQAQHAIAAMKIPKARLTCPHVALACALKIMKHSVSTEWRVECRGCVSWDVPC